MPSRDSRLLGVQQNDTLYLSISENARLFSKGFERPNEAKPEGFRTDGPPGVAARTDIFSFKQIKTEAPPCVH